MAVAAGKAADREFADAPWIDVLDPAGDQIFRQRLLGGHAHDVEPQRLLAAFLDAEHRLRGVFQREAFRRGEGEAELGMQEAPAAHEAFARILAVDEPVELREILVLVARAAARAPRIGGRWPGHC